MVEDIPRILIVDDSPINIKVLNAMLKREFEITVALDGEQALQRIAGGLRPDMVLLDIRMPGMDGYAVCKKLRVDPETRDIPIIFITSLIDEEEEEKGLNLGAVDYITKPFRPAIVMARIKNHLKLKRYQDLLKRRSNLDGLTGISNRRRFDEVLSREWLRGVRSRSPLALVMLDIDFFKAFNDHYGHLAGDECLRNVAQTLDTSLGRSVDFVGRYGGEEFVCVLPDTDLDGALRMAEKLRVVISELAIPHDFSSAAPHVTVSLGMVVAVPSLALFQDQLIEVADEMLYEAKEDGRNCAKGKGIG